MTRHYAVKWEIDVEEESPEAAALAALRMMRAPDSIAVFFKVTDVKAKRTATEVDLEEYAVCDECNNIIHLGKEPFRYAEIVNLFNRIVPGGMVPSCDCPKCGALAYPAAKMLEVEQ